MYRFEAIQEGQMAGQGIIFDDGTTVFRPRLWANPADYGEVVVTVPGQEVVDSMGRRHRTRPTKQRIHVRKRDRHGKLGNAQTLPHINVLRKLGYDIILIDRETGSRQEFKVGGGTRTSTRKTTHPDGSVTVTSSSSRNGGGPGFLNR